MLGNEGKRGEVLGNEGKHHSCHAGWIPVPNPARLTLQL